VAGSSLSVSYVSLLEAGRRVPTEETVASLLEIVGEVGPESAVESSGAWRPVITTCSTGAAVQHPGQLRRG
jgi:hypothetical protein